MKTMSKMAEGSAGCPPLVFNMEDGNTGILRAFEIVYPGQSYMIWFDRFCTPEKLRLDISPEGEVSVWGEADLQAYLNSAEGRERGITLGGSQHVSGCCEFKISVEEARRILWTLHLIEDQLIACPDCNGTGDHWGERVEACGRCGGTGCGECCDGAVQVPDLVPCLSCGGEQMVPESVVRNWSREE